jgi:hypothetical protein
MISEKAHAECLRLLELLINKRVQESWSWVFMTGYHNVIKKAMDLGTVKKNFGSKPSRCRFKSQEKFAKDVRLVFQNALLYNKDDEHVKGSVYDAAQHLLRVFEMAYAKSKETVFKDDNECMTESQNGANKDSLVMNERKLSNLDRNLDENVEQTKVKKDKSNEKEKKSKKSK